jgi:hypothetical protein
LQSLILKYSSFIISVCFWFLLDGFCIEVTFNSPVLERPTAKTSASLFTCLKSKISCYGNTVKYFTFLVLPFVLSSACYIFTKLTRPLVKK